MANSAILVPPQGSIQIGATQTASTSSSIVFSSGITSSYSRYYFIFTDVAQTTSTPALVFLLNADTGSNYYYNILQFASTSNAAQNNGEFLLQYGNMGSAGTAHLSGIVELILPTSSDAYKMVSSKTFLRNGTTYQTVENSGFYNNASAITSITFEMTSSTIANGTFSMFGLI